MQALVIYDSAFGNTAKIAQAIAQGLGTDAQHIGDVDLAQLSALDLVVVGAPTQKLGILESMKAWLDALPDGALKGVQTAAFDTRIDPEDVPTKGIGRFMARVFLKRFAAEPIDALLTAKGGQSLITPVGFFVMDTEGPLREGELERAAAWGRQIAVQMA